MTNSEMRTILLQNGVSSKEIENVLENIDAQKITYIVEAASTPESAFEAIHAFYPDLEVSKMQEQLNYVQAQFEAITNEKKTEEDDFNEKELEMIATGGFCSWFKSNWKKVAIFAAVGVASGGCMMMAAGLVVSGAIVGTVGSFVSAGINAIAS